MTVYFMDGFDPQHAVAEITSATSGTVANSDGGRGGGRELRVSRDAVAIFPPDSIEGETWFGGFTRIVSNFPNSGVRHCWFGVFLDGETTQSVLSIHIARTTSSTTAYAIEIRVGQDLVGTLEGSYSGESFLSAAEVFPTAGAAWQLRLVRGASDGSFEFYLDGSLLLSGSGIAELAATEGPVTSFGMRNLASGTSAVIFGYDDLWVADENLGDARIVALTPDADGFHSDGAPSSGSDNFAMLNEQPPSDATFVTFGAGDRDTYEMDDSELAAVSALRCAAIMLQPRFPGPASVEGVARIGGTDYDLGDTVALDSSQAVGRIISHANPDTVDLWTAADLAAAEFGLEA